MPRKEVVSRKMRVTTALVQAVDMQRGILTTHEVKLKGVPKDKRAFDKKLDKLCAMDNMKFIQLVSYDTKTMMGKMALDDYIRNCYWEEISKA